MDINLVNRNLNRISIFLIIIQSSGIRFFSGIGFCISILVIILNIRNLSCIKTDKVKHLIFLFFLFTSIAFLNKYPFAFILNINLLFISSWLFAIGYTKRGVFLHDLESVLYLLCLYAAFSLLLLPLIYNLLIDITIDVMPYKTFYYLLYYSKSYRICGLCWEPGCMQMWICILILIRIHRNILFLKNLWLCILLLFTASTTGFVNICIVLIYYLIKRKNFFLFAVCIFLILIISVYLLPLIIDKLLTDTSGNIRFANMYCGIITLLKNPLFGVNVTALIDNPDYYNAEVDFWGVNSYFLSSNYGDLPGGFTNGNLSILLAFGLFFGIYLYYNIFRYNIMGKLASFFFVSVFFVTNMSEPLTLTSFFFLIYFLSTFKYKNNAKI